MIDLAVYFFILTEILIDDQKDHSQLHAEKKSHVFNLVELGGIDFNFINDGFKRLLAIFNSLKF